MKKIFTVLAAMAAVFTIVSCNDIKDGGRISVSEGAMSITVMQDAVATKADPSVTANDWEKRIAKLQFFFYEGGTTLCRYEEVANPTFTQGSYTKTFDKLPTSSGYTVIVMANGPSIAAANRGIDKVKALEVTLAHCDVANNGNGFVMYAAQEGIALAGGQTATPSFALTRFPARVRLSSVTNGINASAGYANGNKITVHGVFLTGVMSKWNLAATGAASGAANTALTNVTSAGVFTPSSGYDTQLSRFASLADIAPAATASGINWDTYGFPVAAPESVPASATSKTVPRLVIAATMDGRFQYYPVRLKEGLARNKTYEVNVTICGPGSPDPYTEVQRGTITGTITVSDWTTGAVYNETI